MKVNPLVPLLLGALWYPVLNVNGASILYHGIYLMTLGASIAANPKANIKRNISILLVILFFTFAIIQVPISNNLVLNDLKNLVILLFLFLTSTIFIMPKLMNTNYRAHKPSRTILVIFYLNFVVTILDALNFTNVGSLLTGLDGYRVVGVFGGTSYGGFAAGILTIYCVIYAQNFKSRWILFFLGAIAIGLTGSRSAFLGLLLFGIFMMKLSSVQRITVLLLISGIILTFANNSQALNNLLLLSSIDYAALFNVDFSNFRTIDDFTSDRLDKEFSDGQDGSAKKRLGLLYFSVLSILTGDNILGATLWGYDLHNSFFTIWVVLGFIPFMLFLMPFLFCVIFLLSRYENTTTPLIIIFFASTIFSIFTHIFFMDDLGNRFLWSLFLPSLAFFSQKIRNA